MSIVLILKAWFAGGAHFLRTPIGRVVFTLAFMGLLVFLTYRGGVGAGVKAEQTAQAQRVEKARAHVARVEGEARKISAASQAQHQADTARIAALSVQLQQKVSTYVSPQADRRCIVPVGYVRLRDAAGAGRPIVPAAAGGSLDADSGVALSDVARVDIETAAAFNAAISEVKAWRGWYVAQADLWSKTIKAPDKTP